jgi:ATP-dependent exoDNAse (exonuclease V) beta subunit
MSHVSFSEIKNWNQCAYYHKLTYIDKLKGFQGNLYTAFGSALHSVCEKIVLKEIADKKSLFQLSFSNEINNLPKTIQEDINSKMVSDMRRQGDMLVDLILPQLKNQFETFEVVSVEEKIYEPIEDYDLKFKGFIDLVIKTGDGKYHIIDWKSCSWGWNMKRRADPMTTYQLTFYKHYFAKKHNIEPQNIETYFALLKRTAKKDNVEIFRVTSGNRKTENALNLLNKVLYNIKRKNYFKNRLSCKNCEFYKTEHCA